MKLIVLPHQPAVLYEFRYIGITETSINYFSSDRNLTPRHSSEVVLEHFVASLHKRSGIPQSEQQVAMG
jgi:hypothetical protein